MSILKNPYMSNILKIPLFTKILIFVLLSWIYQYNYNKCTLVKTLENGIRIDTCFDRKTNRLLAKHRDGSELQRIRLQDKANDKVYKHKLSNANESNNIYEHLKHDKLNNVDTYLKSYKSRYAKKKGLKKFDCYFEKILFSSINKLEKHMEKNNLSNNRIKGILFKKYGLPFLLLSLLPALLYALPHRQITKEHKLTPSNGYTFQRNSTTVQELPIKITTESKDLHCFFIYISLTIILSLAIYTYIKIMKYQRIKAGMLK
ncbi:hypothetical protein PVIIG_05720 [Plasmodium vivax India VII]|uniref:Fam-l protein n=1 Tax=Plasmodium vivax India VII TaxID=1077284 RepID=A0A0J9S1U2_PLAVI|nr:hypothetical protein PVIIG_05720 [Plasmodium vivax India VII]